MKKLLIIVLPCIICANAFSKEDSPRQNAIKTTFLSWFTGSCKISYERAVFSNQTIEFTGGYIGFGWDKWENNPRGYTARYAHKLILFGQNSQPLTGFYLRPELIYSDFHYNRQNGNERILSRMGSACFTVGYQYAIRRLVADCFFGSGYAWGKAADTNYQHGFMLWDYGGNNNKNIALTFGMKLGIIF